MDMVAWLAAQRLFCQLVMSSSVPSLPSGPIEERSKLFALLRPCRRCSILRQVLERVPIQRRNLESCKPPCRVVARLFGAARELGQHERGEDAEDDEHQQQFDQSEAPPGAVRTRTSDFRFHGTVLDTGRVRRLGGTLFDVVLQGEDGQHHADEDRADEGRDEEQHQRLGERDRRS
jgi:hypothetical protein